ncbi:MAG: MFS transporter, partial [Actinomycetota bacterium]|nr:MFS transporter [Actinomycetota bacterium]
ADVARGLVAGARHVRSRRPAFYALAMIAGQRLCYGVTIICTVLLYRNYFHANGLLRSGLAGLGQVVAAVAVGGGLAALITPTASRHLGYLRWPAGLLVGAAAVQVTLVVTYALPLVLPAALLLGLASQGIKICVDTVVQRHVEDEFRGRVFSLYDTVFNLTLVLAAALTAWVLPDDGHSPTSVVVIGAAYLAIAATYLYRASRPDCRSPELLAVPLP